MFGSNWPVDSLYGDYKKLIAAYRSIIRDFQANEQIKLFSQNAEKFYRIWDLIFSNLVLATVKNEGRQGITVIGSDPKDIWVNLPLKDLLVVSLEQAVAAPFCTSRLADAGARVIKIEREEGDFARKYVS